MTRDLLAGLCLLAAVLLWGLALTVWTDEDPTEYGLREGPPADLREALSLPVTGLPTLTTPATLTAHSQGATWRESR